MTQEFLSQTNSISYNLKTAETKAFETLEEVQLINPDKVNWLNTYGLSFQTAYKEVVLNNSIDDFVVKLLNDEDHSNKVIQLANIMFVSVRVLKTETPSFDDEMMLFIASTDFVWSIQEKQGDHFEWIRERIKGNKGIVRRKKADYLFYLIIESIIDNYRNTYLKTAGARIDQMNTSNVNPTPEFTSDVEELKQELFHFKRAAMSLRDIITKLEKVQIKGINANYFGELKEQVSNLISDIDFDLQELESKINLIFSIQGHRLNEVMKTLTIFSVIFIPLTFMAGIYGMNFKNIPELNSEYGYFILLGAMLVITIFSIWYFKRKKWF